MTDVQGLTRALTELKPSRRTVLVAAAWTAPAVMGLSAVPAVAGSGTVYSSGDLMSASWTFTGSLNLDQAGRTGWTPTASEHGGDSASHTEWLDPLPWADEGFLSEQDAASATTVEATFTFYVAAKDFGSPFTVGIVVWSNNLAEGTQLLSVSINGSEPLLRYQAGPRVDEDYEFINGSTVAPLVVLPTASVVTVTFTFVLPAGPSGDFWIAAPTMGPGYPPG